MPASPAFRECAELGLVLRLALGAASVGLSACAGAPPSAPSAPSTAPSPLSAAPLSAAPNASSAPKPLQGTPQCANGTPAGSCADAKAAVGGAATQPPRENTL